jgi:glycerate 2-kinase
VIAAAGRVLVAPDSFKGTFAAAEVARAVAAGLERAGLTAKSCPLADGGEGTLDVVAAATGARLHELPVSGPLGERVRARFGIFSDGTTALVEAAQAAGLGLVPVGERDPERATTAGVGELIAAAVAARARRVLVAVGGTATTDGGAGAVQAVEAAGGLRGAELRVLCDVRTRFADAARVFGPQKGADAVAVERLTARLADLAERYPRDPRRAVGGGAGGGLAGGLWAALGATLVPGAEAVLDLVGFDARLARAGALVTGEGRLDAQTGEGKLIFEVCRRARARGIRSDAIVGSSELSVEEASALGLATVREASTIQEIERAAESLGAELS